MTKPHGKNRGAVRSAKRITIRPEIVAKTVHEYIRQPLLVQLRTPGEAHRKRKSHNKPCLRLPAEITGRRASCFTTNRRSDVNASSSGGSRCWQILPLPPRKRAPSNTRNRERPTCAPCNAAPFFLRGACSLYSVAMSETGTTSSSSY